MVKHIYLMIGVPGVGKSTFIRQERFKNSFVVSSDDYIEAEVKKRNSTYDAEFKSLIKDATRHFNETYQAALDRGEISIIVDRTNLTRASRLRFIQDAKKYGYEIYACDLNNLAFDDPEEWNRRLNSRPGKTIPKIVLDQMLKSYEPATYDEGFHFVYKRSE